MPNGIAHTSKHSQAAAVQTTRELALVANTKHLAYLHASQKSLLCAASYVPSVHLLSHMSSTPVRAVYQTCSQATSSWCCL